jgi:hypothetical protein
MMDKASMAAQPIAHFKYLLSQMEIEISTVFHYATLLGVLTAGPMLKTQFEGIRRLLGDIRDRTEAIRGFREYFVQAVHQLANPQENMECA